MKENSKLYTRSEVRDLIIKSVNELYGTVVSEGNEGEESVSTRIDQWSNKWLPFAENAVASEVVRRHPQGISLSVWAGPPASGKGTNIRTLDIMGEAYAEVTSQGFEARFDYELHKKILTYSLDKSTVITGTDGIFNKPKGDYLELFAKLDRVTAEYVAHGGIPDGVLASPLVELMVLYRLVDGGHRIQLDLWPRLPDQLSHYVKLVNIIREAGGSVVEEFVNIKLLSENSLDKVRNNPSEIASSSIRIGKYIREIMATDEYSIASSKGENIKDSEKRYFFEKGFLDKVVSDLKRKFNDSSSNIVLEEVEKIIERADFRFHKVLKAGGEIRPDAYPVAVLKRISVYVEMTSPAFLNAESHGVPVILVSTYSSPEKVVSDIFEQLFGISTDVRWEKFIVLAGEVANHIVQGKDLIKEDLYRRVRGILASEF